MCVMLIEMTSKMDVSSSTLFIISLHNCLESKGVNSSESLLVKRPG